MSQFMDRTLSSNIVDAAVFLLSILVTGARFMSLLLLVLEFGDFFFIRDLPEIQKSEISQSEFCPISGDWGELGIPNLTPMSLIKGY